MSDKREPPAGFEVLPDISPFITHNGPFYTKVSGEHAGAVLGAWVSPYSANSSGYAHGGYLLGFADIALSYLIQGVTLNLNADFTRAVKAGSWIQGHINERKRSRSLIFADVYITWEGKDIMRASGLFKPYVARG